MLTIKKIFLFVSTALLILSQLGASEPDRPDISNRYSFSFTPSVGILYGRVEEIVFKYPKGDQYVSQLLWDLKPLIYFGMEFRMFPGETFPENGFFTAGSIKFGLPFKAGAMENRDWQYPDNENLTNYSWSEAYSQGSVLADISAGSSWVLNDSLTLDLYGQFSFMHFSWMAENGYYQYLETTDGVINPGQIWHEDIPKIGIFGPGIRYIQNWFILSPGFTLRGKIAQHFTTGISFNYSPLVFCIARDDHLMRNIIFWDSLFLGHYINGSCNISIRTNGNTELSLALSYRLITELRGPSFQARTGANQSGRPTQSTRDAGAGFSAFDLSLAMKIPLFGRN